MRRALTWLVAMWFLAWGPLAQAQRVALLIGNATYPVGRLTNPPNDVREMQAALEAVGFKVQTALNANQNQMKRAVRDFGDLAQGAEVAFLYYSGHGTQANGENYLIPVNAEIRKEADYEVEAVSANALMRQISGARPKAAIVVLDACRDNPYASATKSTAKGLGRMDAPTGTMIAFATAPNTTTGDDGYYARVLAAQIKKPGAELLDVFRDTAKEVLRLTGGKQDPRMSEVSINERVYLAAKPEPVVPAPRPEPTRSAAQSAVPDPKPAPVSTIPTAPPTSLTTAAQLDGTIRVGVLHSLSGSMANSETVLKDTVLMAIDEINAKGGVLGKKLEAVVVDPASNWPLFAEKARQLIERDKVAVVFGGWTSVSRKSVLPVFEQANALLFYPVAYEGEELSKNVFYTGAVPNQQAIPAAEYLLSPRAGGGAKRFLLLGTDYVNPRTANKILRAFLKSRGIADADIIEEYVPFGHVDFQAIVGRLRKLTGDGKKMAVISTINGDSNVPFYSELGHQGLSAADLTVVSLSLSETELRSIDTKPLIGHLAAWSYFMSIKSPANEEFKRKWAAYASAKRLPGADKPLTNDPMEATYIGINMWKQAVEKARSTDTDKVIAAMAGQTFAAPSGVTVKMDERNHHLQRGLFIGRVRSDGQFNVDFQTGGLIKGEPWSSFLPGNTGKRDEPQPK